MSANIKLKRTASRSFLATARLSCLNSFTDILYKICSKVINKHPPHLKRVATLPYKSMKFVTSFRCTEMKFSKHFKTVQVNCCSCHKSLYHNCDSTTTRPRRIRLRRKWSKLRFPFDSTAIRLRQDYDEKLTCSFFARVESCRMEADARDTS